MMKPIKLNYQNQHLSINPLGGGIMEYYLIDDGKRREIIYGYHDIEEKEGPPAVASAKAGSMGDILFPFPGRVENSRYKFAGKEHQLSDVKIKDGHAIHGFAKLAGWEILKRGVDFAELQFEINSTSYKERGFPFNLRLKIRYCLDGRGLTVSSEVINFGESDAPFGLGFHPYFSVGTNNIDEMILSIKADKLVEFDEGLKPTGKLLDVVGTDLDFNQPKEIGKRIIDNCYTELHFRTHLRGGSVFRLEGEKTQNCIHLGGGQAGLLRGGMIGGISETKISNGRNINFTIWQDESFPYLQVYSADTIGDEHRRKGFAIEPQTCTGFAFNTPKMGLITLKPGEKFEGNWGVRIN